MFLGIRFVQKQKSLFSVDKPVLDTAQEPRASPQKIVACGKRTTHSEKTGIGYKNTALLCRKSGSMKQSGEEDRKVQSES